METGKIKFYNKEKGYGFIKKENTTEEVFFHHTGLLKTAKSSIKDGDNVAFSVRAGKKGSEAYNIAIL